MIINQSQPPGLNHGSIKTVITKNGKYIYLIGTNHVSSTSPQQVKQLINQIRPECIALELCEERYPPRRVQITIPFQQPPGPNTVAHSLETGLQRFYANLAFLLNVNPGDEFFVAYSEAKRLRIPVYPIDMKFSVTKNKISTLFPYHLVYIIPYFLMHPDPVPKELGGMEGLIKIFLAANKGQRISPEKEQILKHFVHSTGTGFFMVPSLKKPLLDDRNKFMASHLRQLPYKSIIGVFGEQHLDGIIEHIHDNIPDELAYQKQLEEMPKFNRKKFLGVGLLGSTVSGYWMIKMMKKYRFMRYMVFGGVSYVSYVLWREFTCIKRLTEEIKKE